MKNRALWMLLCGCFLAVLPARADGPASVIHFIREPAVYGDELVPTLERTVDFSTLGDVFITADARHVNIQFDAWSGFYAIGFAAPAGETLRVGDYLDTARYPFEVGTHPGLSFDVSSDISEDNIGGNTELGQFHVREISFDADGNLLSFAADFANHDDYFPSAVYGEIRYHSSVPLAQPASAELSAPSHRVFESTGALTVNVARRGSLQGALTVNYATEDGTALAGRDYTAVTGTLTWADGDKHDKTFTVPIVNSGDPALAAGRFYVRLSGDAAGGQREAWVDVVNDNPGDTLMHYQSDTGDGVGQGLEKFFSVANGYTITATGNPAGGVSLTIEDERSLQTGDLEDDETYTLNFAPAAGADLAVGSYSGAAMYGTQKAGQPGFGFKGLTSDSPPATGDFDVLDLAFDAAGNVAAFAADFTAHYGAGPDEPALHGQVRYHSNAALPPRRLPQVGAIVLYPSTIAETSRYPANLVLTRTGTLSQPLTVFYKVAGDAVAGRDYRPMTGVKTIPANLNSAVVKLHPLRSGRGYGRVTAKLVVKPQAGSYDVGAYKNAKVIIGQGP